MLHHVCTKLHMYTLLVVEDIKMIFCHYTARIYINLINRVERFNIDNEEWE